MTSEPNSSQLRDSGLAAFKSQDLTTALARLTEAIQQTPDDAIAHLYLGGVYHQMGRHQEALQALNQAAQLSPQQPQVRYNLGIVYEKLGQATEARTAYQQALALQPDYPLAAQGLSRLQTPAQPVAPTVPPPPSIPPMPGMPPMATPGYVPTVPQPYNPAQPVAGYVPAQPNYSQPTYGQPAPTDLAGNPQQSYPQQSYPQPAYPQPAYPQMAYGQPPMQPGYAPPNAMGHPGQQWTPYAANALMPRDDSFDLGQAFKDMTRVTLRPDDFFAEERGASGYRAPIAMLLAFSIMLAISGCVITLFKGLNGTQLLSSLLMTAIFLPVTWLVYIVGEFILSGVLYLCSRMFSGDGTFSSVYRTNVFSMAPVALVGIIGITLISPFNPRPTAATYSPFGSRITSPGGYRPASAYTNGTYRNYSNPAMNRFPSNSYSNGSYSNSSYSNGSYNNGMPADAGRFMLFGLLALVWMLFMLVALVRHWFILGKGLIATQNISVGGAVGTIVIYTIIWLVVNAVLFSSIRAAISL